VIRRTLDGRLKVSPDGAIRDRRQLSSDRPRRRGAPDPAQAAWLYAQMVRWGQAPLSDDMCRAAMGCSARPL
jgi:NitT/TauT family transport system ATP-binding protein